MKYESHLFTISFSKNLAKLRGKEQSVFGYRLKILESNLKSNKMLEEYNNCKNKLEKIYGNIGVKVRSKMEKNRPIFLKLRKTKVVQGITKKLEIGNKEISDPNKITMK